MACYFRTSNLLNLHRLNLCKNAYAFTEVSIRKYCSHTKEVDIKVENRLKSYDSVHKGFRIIYRAPNVNYARFAYGFTFLTSSVIFPTIGYGISKNGPGVYPIVLNNVELCSSSTDILMAFGCFSFVIYQICYLIFKYPFRIYYNSFDQKYIAVYQHLLPWKLKNEEFHAGDVSKVKNSYSLWNNDLYKIKHRKSILLEEYFFLPQDFNEMLGYNNTKE